MKLAETSQHTVGRTRLRDAVDKATEVLDIETIRGGFHAASGHYEQLLHDKPSTAGEAIKRSEGLNYWGGVADGLSWVLQAQDDWSPA
jgi:hypothetical protein